MALFMNRLASRQRAANMPCIFCSLGPRPECLQAMGSLQMAVLARAEALSPNAL